MSSSAMALRAAFGDRKPPDISRKITACVACRRLKIRCRMPNSGAPCDRCKKCDLSCTVNRSLQQVLESDMSWKDTVEERLLALEQAVGRRPNDDRTLNEVRAVSRPSAGQNTESGDHFDEQNGWEVVDDGHNAPAAIPASYISEVSGPGPQTVRTDSQNFNDIISRNTIDIETATRFFQSYSRQLDHFLYGINAQYSALESIRKASPLLTEAIITVAALHDQSADYAVCRQSFMRTVSAHTFSKKSTPDDVRGLCIGAFWLSDLSWPLIGLAVRIANEINLNRAFVRPRYNSREWYLDARLYLLVHVCDRHSSIVWGRAPMSETFHDLSIFNAFLKSTYATEHDQRLVSQLEIWSINYRTYKAFGLDTEGDLPTSHIGDFRRISIALDIWRADWQEKFTSDRTPSSDPRQVLTLHYNFAKLYLFSHAYRGRRLLVSRSAIVNSDLDEFSTGAVAAAESILKTINANTQIQSQLNGLPTYFGAMIAFAVVFLIKVAASSQTPIETSQGDLFNLLESTSRKLIDITRCMRNEHILTSISRSIKKLVAKSIQNSKQPNAFTSLPESMYSSGFPWISPDDSIFLGNFDLTGPLYDTDPNFMDFSAV